MLWILLAFACGFFTATQGAVAKKVMDGTNYLLVTWAASLFSLPFFGTYLLVRSEPLPTITPIVIFYLALGGALLVAAVSLYFKALRVGELSRDIPLLSLTPVMMMATSYVMLDQQVSLQGALSIVVVVVGCLLLQRAPGRSFVDMLRAFVYEPGSRLMLMVALIWSITANIDKLCMNEIGPTYYPALANVTITLFFIPLLVITKTPVKRAAVQLWKPLVLIGIIQVLMNVSQMAAVHVAPHVAYVITLKRGGLLLSGLLWGAMLFHERNTGWRLAGSVVIMLGLLLLARGAVST